MDLQPLGALILLIMGICCPIVAAGAAWFYASSEDDAKGGIIIFLFFLVAGVSMIIPGSIKLSTVKHQEYNTQMYEIVSLERGSETEGSFILGCGYVESTQYYYFYTTTPQGYKLERTSYQYTYIVEDKDYGENGKADGSKKPCVYKQKKSKDWYEYYTIYCPVGTIIKEFHA